MKSEDIEVNGVKYTVKEIPASIGLPILFTEDNKMDNIAFTCACTSVGGTPLDPSKVNTGVMMKLIPVALRLNGITFGDSVGN